MADYISREAAIKAAKCHYPKANEMIAGIILVPAADVVARDCYDRILAENDTMREMLARIGKKCGDSMDDVAEVVRCRDCYAYRRDPELAKAACLDPEQYCALLRCEFPSDGFCFYGRRDDNGK